MRPLDEKPQLGRVVTSGVASGFVINAVEYGAHRILLDARWTTAFAALGKTPTGWTTFIPANFLVGIIAIWIYARMRPKFGAGSGSALRVALLMWIVFWVIPTMAMQPLNLFPNDLLFLVIAIGFLDSICGVMLGAWIYK